jgi:predicted MFS family arabinose efflux permease
VASVPGRVHQLLPIRNGSFGLLWTGQLLSAIGTWLMVVAVPVFVFHLTRSARETGLALAAEIVPMVALGPVAGVFADRWSRRKTMVTSNICRAGSVLPLVLFTSPDRVWILLASVIAENSFGMFFTPAYRGLVPYVVGRDADLEAANAWNTAASGITRLAGAPLGGVAYLALGFRWVVMLDAASYLISASCILEMPALRRAAKPAPAGDSPVGPRHQGYLREIATEFLAGLSRLLHDRVLSVLAGVSALFLLGNGGLSALLIPYIATDLRGGAKRVGILLSALGAGYLLSAYVGRKICGSPHLRMNIIALICGIVLAFAGFFHSRSFPAALVFIGLAGIPSGAFLMLEQTLIQRLSPDDIIGRISAAYSTIENGATLLGALLASLLEQVLRLTMTLNVSIAVIAAGGALAILIRADTQPQTAAGAAEKGADPPRSRPAGRRLAVAAHRARVRAWKLRDSDGLPGLPVVPGLHQSEGVGEERVAAEVDHVAGGS